MHELNKYKISITNSSINGVSSIKTDDISVSDNSKIEATSLNIESSKISIINSNISGVSSIKASDFFVSDNSEIEANSLNIESSKISIINSNIYRVSSIKANDFFISDNSKILGTTALNIDSYIVYILKSEINSIEGWKGRGEGRIRERGKDGGNGGDSSLSIASKSTLLISSSKISSGNGGYGGNGADSGRGRYGQYGGNGGNGGDSSLSIKSESNLSISGSEISSGRGGYGGDGLSCGYGGNGGDSSLSIVSKSNFSISSSKISSGRGGNRGYGLDCYIINNGNGGDSSLSIKSEYNLSISGSEISSGIGDYSGYKDGSEYSSLSIISQQLYSIDTIFNKPFDGIKNNTVAYFTNTILPSINVADNAIVYKYLYIISDVTDKLGHPVYNAKVDVLYYLNETTYKSGTTDLNGTAKIPVLSNIITSQGDQFLGNYKIVAYYQNHITSKKGVEMKSNQNVALNFSDLVVEPVSVLQATDNISGSIELLPLISGAQASIKKANQIFADTSEAEKLLQQSQAFKEKNELPYAIEFAFRAMKSAENAKNIRIVEYFGGFIVLIIALLLYKYKNKQ